MQSSVVCPGCRAQYQVDQSKLGRSVKCKKCQTVFLLEPTLPEGLEFAEVPISVPQSLTTDVTQHIDMLRDGDGVVRPIGWVLLTAHWLGRLSILLGPIYFVFAGWWSSPDSGWFNSGIPALDYANGRALGTAFAALLCVWIGTLLGFEYVMFRLESRYSRALKGGEKKQA